MGRTQSYMAADHLFQVGHTQNLFFDRSRWMHLSHLFFHSVLDTLGGFPYQTTGQSITEVT